MKNRAVTIAAFFISAGVHAAVIGAAAWFGFFGRAGSFPPAAPAVKSTSSYVILPDIEIISERSLMKKSMVEKPPQEKQAESGGAGAAAGGDAKESVFEYKDAVQRRIQEARGYPEEARREGTQGVVGVAFTILPDGSVAYAGVANSSGFATLDEEAVNTVKRASPFPRFPGVAGLKKMDLQVSIIFRLN